MSGNAGWGAYSVRWTYGLMMRESGSDDQAWETICDACGQPLKFATQEQAEAHATDLLSANAHFAPGAQIIIIRPGQITNLLMISSKGDTDD